MALADNLVAYWELEEASGDRVDSHSTYDLTQSGTPSNATGVQGNGVDLELSSSQHLYVADPFHISNNLSISSWIKPESFTNNDNRWICRWYNQTEYILRLNAGKVDVLHSCSGGTVQVTGASSLSTGTWYHIVTTYNSTDGLKVYVNNGSPLTAAANGTINNSVEPFTIGVARSSGGAVAAGTLFDGIVDEVGVWDKTLTTDEVAELYNSGAGMSYADITGGAAPTFIPRVSFIM